MTRYGLRIALAVFSTATAAFAADDSASLPPNVKQTAAVVGGPTNGPVPTTGARAFRVVRLNEPAMAPGAPSSDGVFVSDIPVASNGLADRLTSSRGFAASAGPESSIRPSMQLANHRGGVVEDGCACGSSCESCCDCCDECCECCDCCDCCDPIWRHRCSVWGGFLYLQPTGVDMAHAIQQNGTGGAGTVPDGRVGTSAPDYQPGFTVGASWAMTDCSSIWASYTQFESNTADSLLAPPGVGGTVSSLVLHPGTLNAGSTTSLVNATYGIEYKLADVNYSHLLSANDRHAINYHVGARYGNLEQNFKQVGVFAPPTGDLRTTSEINFDGGGPRWGLDGRAKLCDGGFSVYGNTFFSLLFGGFRSTYQQYDFTTDTSQALSYWNDHRMVSLLETELGLSWTSCSGCVRVSAGYYVGWWFNSITVPEHIQAVQNNNFVNVGDTLTFDGLTTRVEVRF